MTEEMIHQAAQARMNELAAKVMLFDVNRCSSHLSRTKKPVMSDEDREFVAQGFDSLAKSAREHNNPKTIHMWDPAYADHLAALARSNFVKGTRY